MTTKKSPTASEPYSSLSEPSALPMPTISVSPNGNLRVNFHDYTLDLLPTARHLRILMQMLELRQYGASTKLGEPGSLTAAQIAELVKKAQMARRKYNLAIDLRSLGL